MCVKSIHEVFVNDCLFFFFFNDEGMTIILLANVY